MTTEALVPQTGQVPGDPAGPVGRGRRRAVLGTLAAVLPFVVVGAARATYFAEGDTFWATRTGAEILRQRTILLPDTFSWTVAGQLWHPNSWSYDVLLHLADQRWGRAGLGLVALLSVTATGVGVAVAGRLLGARPGPQIVVGFLAMPVLVAWLSTRPQTVSYALLPLTVGLAAVVVQRSGRRLLIGLAGLLLLSAAWVNLHLAALSAVVVTAAGLGVLLAARPRQWRTIVPRGAAVVAATLLGCSCSPLGWSVVGSALATRDASTTLITEWAPLWRATPACQATWLAALVGLGLTLASWRRRPQDVMLPVWSGATAALLVLGISAARFSAMALVLSLPAVALWVSDTDWTTARWRQSARWLAPRVVAAVAVGFSVIAVVRLPHVGEPNAGSATRAVVDAVPAGCRVLNEYDEGGWITYLRADDGVLVAQDGRNDVYGVAVLAEVQELIDGRPGALAELARRDVWCILLDPDRPVVEQARSAGWVEVAADRYRVLLVAPR